MKYASWKRKRADGKTSHDLISEDGIIRAQIVFGGKPHRGYTATVIGSPQPPVKFATLIHAKWHCRKLLLLLEA